MKLHDRFKAQLINLPYSAGATSLTFSHVNGLTDPATVGNYKLLVFNRGVGDPGDAENATDAVDVITVTGIDTENDTLTVDPTSIAFGTGTNWIVVSSIFAENMADKASLSAANSFTGLQTFDQMPEVGGESLLKANSFDPEYEPLSGAFDTITYNSAREGFWVQVNDRLVYLFGEISTDNVVVGSASGGVVITIPFEVRNITAAGMGGWVNTVINFAGTAPTTIVARNGFSQLIPRYQPTSSSGLSVSDLTAGSASRQNRINFGALIDIA